MKTPARHVDFLDYIRGIAILGVFCFHSLGAAFGSSQLPWSGHFRSFDVSRDFLLVWPAMFGSLGVALFFVVSGFCIHLSFRRTPDWREFFRRRFFRIYPPYLTAVLLFAFVFPVSRLSYSSLTDYANLISHVLLFHNLDDRSYFGINPAFWSIAIEVQLYLLYPCVLMLSRRQGWRQALWLLALVEGTLRVVCLTLDLLGASCPRLLNGSPFSYWFSWGIGAYLAEEYLQGNRLPFATWSVPVLTITSFGSMFFEPFSYFTFPLFSLITAAIIARRLTDRRGSRAPGLVLRHLRTAGIWSFSLYLLHQPLLKGLMLLIPASPDRAIATPLARFAICIASWFVILPVAGLAYRWCELPSISFGHWVLRKSRLRLPVIEQV
jgi:peptidoglycan/LPS O-acetylase OafA/YrhL